jgi:ATP-binding cassette subfamily C protein LapB
MLRIVDRVIVMDNGKVLMDGPRDAVLERLRKNKAARTTVKTVAVNKAQEV